MMLFSLLLCRYDICQNKIKNERKEEGKERREGGRINTRLASNRSFGLESDCPLSCG